MATSICSHLSKSGLSLCSLLSSPNDATNLEHNKTLALVMSLSSSLSDDPPPLAGALPPDPAGVLGVCCPLARDLDLRPLLALIVPALRPNTWAHNLS